MKPSESSFRLQNMIKRAIDDHKISREEYDQIIELTNEDGHIDSQEKALLEQLQNMIENKEVRFSNK